MVRGLAVFKEYFKEYADNYIIIGGTACDVIIDNAGFDARATKDIDIVLIVEALSKEFVLQFWQFIVDGKYQQTEKNADERKYYRFMKPENKNFPFQIELFSRIPDLMDLEGTPHLTPIPVEDNLSSLSAILMNEEYYKFTIDNSTEENSVHIANHETLICLKAKAFLDLVERKSEGQKIDDKNIRKHKTDIFRLLVLLAPEQKFSLPDGIKKDMQFFVNSIVSELPDKAIFKQMGLSAINADAVFKQLKQAFDLR